MKNISIYLIIILSLVGISCSNVGLLGQGGVSGRDVKKEILYTVNSNTFSYYYLLTNKLNAQLTASFGNSSYNIPFSWVTASSILQITIDNVMVPGLLGIEDSRHYSRISVDDCKNNIMRYNLLLGSAGSGPGVAVGDLSASAQIPSVSAIAGIHCNLKTTPLILQLGDGNTGNYIQLGPLGL